MNKINFQTPLCSVDIAIFCLQNDELRVLLMKRPNSESEPFRDEWALVGGFVDIEKDENLLATAHRKLFEKTAISAPYLEQLGSWGSKERDPRFWSVTIAYFALLPKSANLSTIAGGNAQDIKWAKVTGNGIEESLAFDHKEILSEAIKRLRNKVEYTSLPAYLLGEKFTLAQLQKSFEVILGRKLEKSAFRTRIHSANIIEGLDEYIKGPNRPAQLFKLRDNKRPAFFSHTFRN